MSGIARSAVTYLEGPETTLRRELEFGVVREPPAPLYGHQRVITKLATILERHVEARDLGHVCVSPIDVILDPGAGLIVQPDLIFVSKARGEIVAGQIWGPPDLVVEVLSQGTAHRDRTLKRSWYQQYGVREYWLIDGHAREVTSVCFEETRGESVRRGVETIRSVVLPRLRLRIDRMFD